MSNILKVTTPVVGYDNANGVKTNPNNVNPQNSTIKGQVAPDKVVRPDGRSDAASQQPENLQKFRYETNFDNFIQQIFRNPSIAKDFSAEFLAKLGILAQSGLRADFAEEISEFLSMISMSPAEMSAFLKNQGQTAVRFSGALFEVLRQIMQQSGSVELRAGILDFLKRYTDMAEGDHLLENIRQLQQQIKQGMFRNAREQLEQMDQQINYKDVAKGNVKQNADLLKNQILPFLNEYISQTHDRGNLRENAAMLSAFTARYENGDASRLLDAFTKLMDFPAFSKFFQNMAPDKLLMVLANTEFEKASAQNNAMERFAELIHRGAMGDAGHENKSVFKELMRALLLNESVYMPVLHMTLPLNIDDKLMFSELWIDPDDKQTREDGTEERMIRGLIKFDIKDVGFFDLFFLYGSKSEKVRMQLNYPKLLESNEAEIRTSLERILVENGLSKEELILGTEEGSIAISEAFPNIFERKNSINVTV